jgi:3-oxoacyl-[acyl-carrier protein] reductase
VVEAASAESCATFFPKMVGLYVSQIFRRKVRAKPLRLSPDVCVADISEESARQTVAAISGQNPDCLAMRADTSNAGDVTKVIDACMQRFKHIDAIVNNAGVTDKLQRMILDLPYESWQEIISVNLTGAYTCLKECAKVMKEQGAGNIVNITSLLGQRGYTFVGGTAYGVSKAALEALTEYASEEFKEFKINVNSAYPGVMVNTGFFDWMDEAEKNKLASPLIMNELHTLNALYRKFLPG